MRNYSRKLKNRIFMLTMGIAYLLSPIVLPLQSFAAITGGQTITLAYVDNTESNVLQELCGTDGTINTHVKAVLPEEKAFEFISIERGENYEGSGGSGGSSGPVDIPGEGGTSDGSSSSTPKPDATAAPKTTIKIVGDSQVKVGAEVSYSLNTGAKASWKSSDTSIIALKDSKNSTGKSVTFVAKKAGTTNITATSDGKSPSLQVTVVKGDVKHKITSKCDEKNGDGEPLLKIGETATLTVTNASGKEVTWEVGDKNLVSLSGSGDSVTAKALKAGATKVTAKIDKDTEVSIQVHVKEDVDNFDFTKDSREVTISVGSTATLSVKGLSSSHYDSVTYKIDDGKANIEIVGDKKGKSVKIKGVKAGEASITATYKKGGQTCYAYALITVTKKSNTAVALKPYFPNDTSGNTITVYDSNTLMVYTIKGVPKDADASLFLPNMTKKSNVPVVNHSLALDGTDATNVWNITLDMKTYATLASKEKQAVMEAALNDIKESQLSTINRNKMYSFVEASDETTASLVRQLSNSIRGDFFKAYSVFRPFGGVVGIILGVVTLVIIALLGLAIVFDLAYIVIPAFRLWLDDLKTDKNWVSEEAKLAVKNFEDVTKAGRSPLGIYFKLKTKQFMILSICILYLVSGQIYELIARLMDLVQGFVK